MLHASEARLSNLGMLAAFFVLITVVCACVSIVVIQIDIRTKEERGDANMITVPMLLKIPS